LVQGLALVYGSSINNDNAGRIKPKLVLCSIKTAEEEQLNKGAISTITTSFNTKEASRFRLQQMG
jgi:hypothetical protein